MNFIAWVLERFGWIGGLGFVAAILGFILVAGGGGAVGGPILIGGVVVIVLAKKFYWP